MEVGGDAERRGDGHGAPEVVVSRDGVGDCRAVRGHRDDGLDAAALGVEGVGADSGCPLAVPKPFGDGRAAAIAGGDTEPNSVARAFIHSFYEFTCYSRNAYQFVASGSSLKHS